LAIQALRAAHERPADRHDPGPAALPAGGRLAFWNRLASDGLDALWNRAWLDPLLKGTYPALMDDFLKGHVRDGDLKTVRQPIDFLGVNYYAPAYVKLDLASPSHIAPAAAQGRGTGRLRPPDRPVGPGRGAGDGPPRLRQSAGADHRERLLRPVRQRPGGDRRHVPQPVPAPPPRGGEGAMEAGSRIGGYFTWTLIDNWEWDIGYTSKFGLVAMDRATGVRTPKASYGVVQGVARRGLAILSLAGGEGRRGKSAMTARYFPVRRLCDTSPAMGRI
jgi:beta-glucosidase